MLCVKCIKGMLILELGQPLLMSVDILTRHEEFYMGKVVQFM